MRALALAFTALLSLGVPASAASPLEGPLAAPDAAPAVKPKPAKTKTAHHKAKTHHEATRPVAAASDGAPETPKAVVHSNSGDPADPVSFGMKWSGNSDNARETRVQNYNAGAAGSGGEVGFKFHF